VNVRLLESALRHLVEGHRFYEAQAPQLGTHFLRSLFSDIDALAVHGGVHPTFHGFHRSLSKRFPFAIYYTVAAEEVRVHAVLDCRRRPWWIREQLRGSTEG